MLRKVYSTFTYIFSCNISFNTSYKFLNKEIVNDKFSLNNLIEADLKYYISELYKKSLFNI